MKKFYKYIVVLFCSVFLLSCYDLERYPQDELSTATFWQNDDQAKEGIMGCYQCMRYGYIYYYHFMMDVCSDAGQGVGNGFYNITRGTWTSSTSFVLGKWQQTYEGVARTNYVIKSLGTAKNVSDNVKAQIIGEAKFLRALYYFNLITHFGGVPIYDETFDYENNYMDMVKPRNSIDEVRAFILKDLRDAIGALPVKWDASNYGRATKGAAYALEGKVYLYNKQYDLAAKDFEEIVLDPSTKAYGYELYDNLPDLFLPKGDQSDEMIFAIQNYSTAAYSLGMPFAWFMGTISTIGSCWNYLMPSNNLVDSYELKDGKPFNWDDFIPNFKENTSVKQQTFIATLSADKKTVAQYPKYYKELLNMYDQRDPRMQQTVLLPYTHYTGWGGNKPLDCVYVCASGIARTNGFVVPDASYWPYLYRKFVPEGDMDGLMAPTQRANTPINYPIIRYADVLLMLAECYNELGKYDEAVKYINMVRQRPSTNMPKINSGPSWLEARNHDQIFERIKHERLVEFPAEGIRYYDLIRWKQMETPMNGRELDIVDKLRYVKVFDPSKDYLWPIPQVAIDRNPNLTQNPGWQ